MTKFREVADVNKPITRLAHCGAEVLDLCAMKEDETGRFPSQNLGRKGFNRELAVEKDADDGIFFLWDVDVV